MEKVLVTGGTGSFGSYICPMLLKNNFEVYIYSRSEERQRLMKKQFPEITFFIGDVADYQRLQDIFRIKFDVVLNAAALKQIPICEEFPSEAVKTNIQGALNIARICKEKGIWNVIEVSTDKAVHPINIYGYTKALAERIFLNHGFKIVRYGNVLNSTGSVLKEWRENIEKNEPLKITDYDMTRFLITFSEASLLIKEAMEIKESCIIIPELPSHTIRDLAEAYAPSYPKMKIGVRRGEKLHEEMCSNEETRDYLVYCFNLRQQKFRRISKGFNSFNARRLNTDSLRKILVREGCLVS